MLDLQLRQIKDDEHFFNLEIVALFNNRIPFIAIMVVFKILCHFCNLVTKREMTHDQTSIRYGRSASSTQRR